MQARIRLAVFGLICVVFLTGGSVALLTSIGQAPLSAESAREALAEMLRTAPTRERGLMPTLLRRIDPTQLAVAPVTYYSKGTCGIGSFRVDLFRLEYK